MNVTYRQDLLTLSIISRTRKIMLLANGVFLSLNNGQNGQSNENTIIQTFRGYLLTDTNRTAVHHLTKGTLSL
jgi:hypothetical protein